MKQYIKTAIPSHLNSNIHQIHKYNSIQVISSLLQPSTKPPSTQTKSSIKPHPLIQHPTSHRLSTIHTPHTLLHIQQTKMPAGLPNIRSASMTPQDALRAQQQAAKQTPTSSASSISSSETLYEATPVQTTAAGKKSTLRSIRDAMVHIAPRN
jgi:hypothetical protein